MSAGTIKLTNGSTAVVGTSTTFTSDLKSGDVITTTIGGVFYNLFVDTVTSNTAATLTDAFTGPTTTGAAYVAVPQMTLNRITAALAAQTAESVRRMLQENANWQAFYSGTGDITVTLPDGTPTGRQVLGPSWAKMMSTIGSPRQFRGDLGTADLNTIDGSVDGDYNQPRNANATTARNYPINVAGSLQVYSTNANNLKSCVQEYRVWDRSATYVRVGTSTAAGVVTWTIWVDVAVGVFRSTLATSTTDINTFTTEASFGVVRVTSANGTLAMGWPYDGFAGKVTTEQGYGSGAQQTAVSNYGNQYNRYLSSATTWSPWVKQDILAAPNFYVGNADTLLDDGDYPTSSATTGLPDPALFGGTQPPNNCRLYVRTLRSNTSVTQIWTAFGSNATHNGRTFHREKYSTNAWSEWREILDENSMFWVLGYGLSARSRGAVDWQQDNFKIGESFYVNGGNMTNTPTGMDPTTLNVDVHVRCGDGTSVRIIDVVYSTTTTSGYRKYELRLSGTAGARTIIVRQVWTQHDVVPLANGGTGATTAAAARTALGLGGAATLDVGNKVGTVAAGDDSRIVSAVQPKTAPEFSSIELSAATPFIDFHYGSSTADFTSRVIARATGNITVMGPGNGGGRFMVDGGYVCRRGLIGEASGNVFNFYWNTGSNLELWVDGVSLGNVAMQSTSDRELKKDIVYQSRNGALAEVNAWRPATFKMKSRDIIPESCEMLGFIANDVIEVSPECVTGKGLEEGWDENNPDSPYTLDTTAMLAKAVMAIQELKLEVDSLKVALASAGSQKADDAEVVTEPVDTSTAEENQPDTQS